MESTTSWLQQNRWANSSTQQIDVEKVIIRQSDKLNQQQIFDELKPLAQLKEEPEIITNVEKLFQKHAG